MSQEDKKEVYFISIEGPDGSGKSTEAERLVKQIDGLYTKEPTSGEIGKIIRQHLAGNEISFSHETFQLMYAADRGDHISREITPTLKSGKSVISDRYFFSSIAFGASQGVDFNWLNNINQPFLTPDFLFYMDTPIDTCLDRLQKRSGGKTELFERKDTLEKVALCYKKIFDNFDEIIAIHPIHRQKCQLHILDGTQTVEEINKKILDILKV